jgi:hypothetical protein
MNYTDDDLIADLETKIFDLQEDLDGLYVDRNKFTEENFKKYVRQAKAKLKRAKARLTEEEARM